MIIANTGKQVFTFWKGRVALYAILKALNLSSGDRVLVPGYTCVVVPSAVVFAGYQPVYAEVDPAGFNVTLATLEAALRRSPGRKPRAVIIQHTYGIPVEAGPIIAWARQEGMAVIEDCAHVLDSEYHGAPCGSLGDAAFFSSQWSKPITTGLGGWAVVNNQRLAGRLRQVREGFFPPGPGEIIQLRLQTLAHAVFLRPRLFWALMGLYRRLSGWGVTIGSSSPEELGLARPSRYAQTMSAFQEDLLHRGLAQAEANVAHRRRLAAIYQEGLIVAGFPRPVLPAGASATYVRYPVRVKNKEALLNIARRRRLEMGDWFVSPLHPLIEGWEKLAYEKGSCPVAEELCRTVVNLPTHLRITAAEARKLLATVVTEGEPCG